MIVEMEFMIQEKMLWFLILPVEKLEYRMKESKIGLYKIVELVCNFSDLKLGLALKLNRSHSWHVSIVVMYLLGCMKMFLKSIDSKLNFLICSSDENNLTNCQLFIDINSLRICTAFYGFESTPL